MITKEDMVVLKGYDKQFRTAIENGYARHLGSRAYSALNEIYRRITGNYYSVNYGCSYCALQFIKALGKLYLEELAREETVAETASTADTAATEEQALELLNILDEIMDEVPDEEPAPVVDTVDDAPNVEPEPEPEMVTPSVSKDKTGRGTTKATNKKQK